MIRILESTNRNVYLYKRCIAILLLFSLTIVTGCGKTVENITGDATAGASTAVESKDIFTKYGDDDIAEIDYWLGDSKVAIYNKEDIQRIYTSLSLLKLTKASPIAKIVDGFTAFDLVMNDNTVLRLTWSNTLNINRTRYDTDREAIQSILNSIRKAALENGIANGNDIFTRSIYEHLLEIDYWKGDEKKVISNKDDLRYIYYCLSSMTLEEAAPEYAPIAERIIVDFVMEDKTISISLWPNVVGINGKRYYASSNPASVFKNCY